MAVASASNANFNGKITLQGVTVEAGTGAPAHTAAKGSLYIRLDGSSTSTRMYVNTDGGTTWTNFTTAA